jgi:hypothetical protein
MTERLASCSCGQLTARTTADPIRVSICHCRTCQRRTGSPFGMQARFDRASVTVTGTSTCWERTADSGRRLAFHFCPVCGATVHYGFVDMPGFIGIPVGAFGDPQFPPPSISVFEEAMHPWVGLPDGIRHAR